MAKLYLGDTEIAPIVEVPVEKKKYGMGIGAIFGNTDENGLYHLPEEPFTPDFSQIKSVPHYAFYYTFYNNLEITGDINIGLEGALNSVSAFDHAFYGCPRVTGIIIDGLTSITGASAMAYTFNSGSNLSKVSLRSLATVNASSALNSCFFGASKLTSIDLSGLTTISGTSAMNACFRGCNNLVSINVDSLTTINGVNAMSACFFGCNKLPILSFPSLQEILPLTTQNQFANMVGSCPALLEIHFPAAMQSRVEQLDGYSSRWGANNATIYFDL